MRDTIDMAREAGFNLNFRITGSNEALDRLVEYVRADTLANIDPSKFMSYQEAYEVGQVAEREACAKVCESLPMQQEIDVRDECAAAIRNRGNI